MDEKNGFYANRNFIMLCMGILFLYLITKLNNPLSQWITGVFGVLMISASFGAFTLERDRICKLEYPCGFKAEIPESDVTNMVEEIVSCPMHGKKCSGKKR